MNDESARGYWVDCPVCDASAQVFTEDTAAEAAAIWNKRVPPARPASATGSPWIETAERAPDSMDGVLVTRPDPDGHPMVTLAYWDGRYWYRLDHSERISPPLAWQPLPEAYTIPSNDVGNR